LHYLPKGREMLTTDEKIRLFKSLFFGRMDCYGVGEGVCIKEPLDVGVIRNHLLGVKRIGVYMVLKDKTAFAVFDVDRDSIEDVKELISVSASYDIKYHVEKSKSKGYHIWYFFSEPVSALKVRSLLNHILIESRIIKLEIFPKQNVVEDGKYGNYTNLPLFKTDLPNRTAFLDVNTWLPFENQWEYLASIVKTTPEEFENIIEINSVNALMADDSEAETEPEKDKKTFKVEAGFKADIDLVIEKCEFVKYCIDNAKALTEPSWYDMIGNLAFIDGGAEKIHEYSEPYPDYSYAETQEKIEHAIKDGKAPTTCAVIQEHGFTCTKQCDTKAPAGLAYKPDKKQKKEKKGDSQATILVKMCLDNNDIDLWHTKDKIPMATFAIENHQENWTTNSKIFKEHLQHLYFEQYKTSCGKSAVGDALGVIDSYARFDGVEKDVYTRLAYVGEKIYLDLCTDSWQSVEIDSKGWRVVDKSTVAFRRGRGMLSLPLPSKDGYIYELFEIFHVDTTEQNLIASWLLGAMNQKGPFPILVVNGEQGSGKSTLCSLLKRILDPGIANTKTLPREERDLIISASNSWLLSYDNISGFPDWISDAFCRISTGGGLSIRELYSDSEEMIFDVKRPVVLNGIENIGLRSDFADRAILIDLPRIEKRIDEKLLDAKFREKHSIILGGLCDAISMALRNIDSVKLDNLPRMADFALWITASEQALGVKNLVGTYQKNRENQSEVVLGASVIGTAIVDFLSTRTTWEGTCKELLSEIDGIVNENKRKEKSYPKDAIRFSGKLRRVLPQLRQAGIDITFERRTVTLEKKDA
jgi:energy-coupling factor transporter ATP-binding protein EcfA2